MFANGAPTESLFTGPEALRALPENALTEIARIYPDLLDPDRKPRPARQIVQNGRSIKNLLSKLNDYKVPIVIGLDHFLPSIVPARRRQLKPCRRALT